MATTLTIDGNNQLPYVRYSSLVVKYNTVDLTLINPSIMPALGDTLAMTNPTWSGTVVRVTTSDLTQKKGADVQIVKVSATNTDTAGASAAPFNLSDNPDNSTTYGYRDLEIEKSANTDATETTNGRCVIFQEGLWPAMTFQLTSSNQGYTAADFSVTNVTVTWLDDTNPRYEIEFGDPLVTMSVWMNNTASDYILPITSTKIEDGAVTTPKILANAVTASKLAASLVLASVIKTAETGTRVEMSEDGIYLYDSSNNVIVKIPTDDSPVYIAGELSASNFTSTTTAQFQNDTKVAKGGTFTLDSKVEKPSSAPVLAKGYEHYTLDTSGGYAWDVSYGIAYESSYYYVPDYDTDTLTPYVWKFDTSGNYVSVSTLESLLMGWVNGFGMDATYWYIYSWDGYIHKFLRSNGSLVSSTDVKSYIYSAMYATMFYDATATKLVLVTVTGAGAGQQLKFVTYDPATMNYSASLIASGFSITGAEYAFCGGAYYSGKYWVNVVSSTSGTYTNLVLPFNSSTGAYVSNGIFGYKSTGGGQFNAGICHNGSVFVGNTGTAIYITTNWDWTTESDKYWVGYSWYDSDGTTHETEAGPRASITMYRRMRLSVTSAAIPDLGDADDPNNARIYMARNSTEPSAGSYWLQATDTATQRYLTTYTGSGTADSTSNSFPDAGAAELKSASTGWTFYGDGTAQLPGLIQSGKESIAGDNSAYAESTVTFATEFPTTPIVVATVSTGTQNFLCSTNSTSTTSVTIRLFRRDGANFTNTLDVDWVAICGQDS